MVKLGLCVKNSLEVCVDVLIKKKKKKKKKIYIYIYIYIVEHFILNLKLTTFDGMFLLSAVSRDLLIWSLSWCSVMSHNTICTEWP